MVARDFTQEKGLDYHKTYDNPPVAHLTTVRVLLAVINHQNLIAHQLDVKNAFLHRRLKKEIYMKQPQGFEKNRQFVCRLNKSLYGSKQAPRQWNEKFDNFVRSLDFVQSNHDKCLYVYKTNETIVYLLLYVDDMIITGNSEHLINVFKSALMSEFKTKDLRSLKCFLGIKIERGKTGMFLSQPGYVEKLLQKFGMKECHSTRTPMEVLSIHQRNWKEIASLKINLTGNKLGALCI